MAEFFKFLADNRIGIFVLLLILLVAGLLVRWVAYMFGWGRFKVDNNVPQLREQNVSYVLTKAIVNIIDDFRHLLALFIILIFAFALVYTMIRAGADVAKMKESLQAVVATLGGLVGSIIGYYFGQEAAASKNINGGAISSPSEITQKPDTGQDDPNDTSIERAPPPGSSSLESTTPSDFDPTSS